MKKIYVSDSYHTKKIAALLQAVYADNAIVVCELIFKPKDDLLGQILKERTDAEEHYENKADINGIDLFFVSARSVLGQQINVRELKEKYGNDNSKVIVMSVMSEYLDQVKQGNYGADFFLDKDPFVSAYDSEDLDPNYVKQLISYLN